MQATYAVTCEALKHLPALQPILERTQLAQRAGINDSLACVLAFELLFGEGLRPTGPAERAVLQQQVSAHCWAKGRGNMAGAIASTTPDC